MKNRYFYYAYYDGWFDQFELPQKVALQFQSYIDRGVPNYEHDAIVIEVQP
jgi:hypothetical protein